MATILYMGGEFSTGIPLETLLAEFGHQPVLAASMREGFQTLSQRLVDLIVSDSRLPDATGLDLLDALRQRGYRIPVIMIAGFSSLQHAIVSMQHGAVDYLVEPLSKETVRTALTTALQADRPCREWAVAGIETQAG